MNKKALIVLAVFFCFAGFFSLAAAKTTKSWSPIKITIIPGFLGFPEKSNIYGLNLGIGTSTGKNQKVDGVDMALAGAISDNVTGLQMAGLAAYCKDFEGVQLSGAVVKFVKGSGLQISIVTENVNAETAVQIGVGNVATKSKSIFQLGFINNSDRSHGLQIGFLNRMDNGFLPMSFLFNFSVSK